MSAPPEHQAAEARRWFKWAREDLTLAEHTAADPDVARRGACMWAHQAAEKALKAALIAETLVVKRPKLSRTCSSGQHLKRDRLRMLSEGGYSWYSLGNRT